jgi:heme-degrading monooxygenase HmoA
MIACVYHVRAVSVDVVPELCRHFSQAFVQQHIPGLLRSVCLVRVEDRREVLVMSEWASLRSYASWQSSEVHDHLVAQTAPMRELDLQSVMYEET